MKPVSLSDILLEPNVYADGGTLIFQAVPEWIVPGENRLSYTTLVRLAECCRELHWRKDVEPVADDGLLDSTTKTLNAMFIRPIIVGSTILIVYCVTEVRTKSYTIKITFTDAARSLTFAECTMVSVFFDPVKGVALEPPAAVHEHLVQMLQPG